MPGYSEEPPDAAAHTRSTQAFYTRFAGVYDVAVKALPVWKTWLARALPELRGPRVLEVSFGTGWLLTQYAARFEAHGLEYNARMIATATRNLRAAGYDARLVRGAVEVLPYRDATFDCILNTMAFSGYPNARSALSELVRVLKPDGRLVMIDAGYPAGGGWLGTRLADAWKLSGDLLRDMGALFRDTGLLYTDREIGGWGSVHLYVATKTA